MTVRPDPATARLGTRVAAVLRIGTLVAVAVVAVGFVVGLATGAGGGARPVVELVGAGGADSVIAIGLVGLTFLPLGVLGIAAATFHATGERRYLVACLVTLGLLVSSLVVAAVVAGPG